MSTASTAIRGQGNQAFSLLEVVVVAGLVALLAAVMLRPGGGGTGAAVRSARMATGNLLAAAQAHATGSGNRTRLLFDLGSASGVESRYLHWLVLQEQDPADNSWHELDQAAIGGAACFLPPADALPADLMRDRPAWLSPDGALPGSTLLTQPAEANAVTAWPGDRWAAVEFDAEGYPTPAGGTVVFAACRARPDASPPMEVYDPGETRGLLVTRYGACIGRDSDEGMQ